MRLRTLLERLPDGLDTGSMPDIEVLGVQEDSRRLRPGDIFVARKGLGVDGKQFVQAAEATGAVAVVSDGPVEGTSLPVVVVRDAGGAASILANALAGDPSRHMKVIGITGTNGKTTTTFILRHLLGKAGIKSGLIGTCVIDDGLQSQPAAMTTPGAVTLAEILAAMRENGCEAVAMETSSHALAQGRVAGVRYAGAGFTNLTGDHADYHRTMDDYAAAKAQLFMHLDESAVAAVNCGDAWSERLLRHCRGRAVRFSSEAACCCDQRADYSAGDASITADGSMFILHTPTGHAQVKMQLVGRHNIQNAICAASIAGEVFGMSAWDIARGLADAWGAPGRMQRVDAGQPFGVLVDYAHTDDALANVLSALRPITTGKLRVVFGCGGDRDPTKRARMAAVAEKWADAVYVTSDNPRTEQPEKILEQIVAGFESKRPALVEPDRRVAIRKAIAEAQARDVVLIAGKGHETYQILGNTKYPFDDAEEARQALQSLGS